MRSVERASMVTILWSFVIAIPTLILPILIWAAVVNGVIIASEVSTIGITYAVLAGMLVYRKFNWRRIPSILVESASFAGAILFFIGCVSCMA